MSRVALPMPRGNSVGRFRALRWSTGVAVLALFSLSSCVNMTDRFVARYSAKDAKVSAIVEQAARDLESQMADGPDYFLTELRGMDAANKLGNEGKDASVLWEHEINRHYREGQQQALLAIHKEISTYDPKWIDSILAAYVPNAVNRHWKGRKVNTPETGWGLHHFKAARTAHIAADCKSLESTPEIWRQLYPEREPFTFIRFGIDEPLMRKWCALLNR